MSGAAPPAQAVALVVRYPLARRVGWPLALVGAGALCAAALVAGLRHGVLAAVALFPFAALAVLTAPVLAWRLGTFAVRVDHTGVHRRRGRRWASVPWAAVAAVEVGRGLRTGARAPVATAAGRDGRSLRLLDARGRTLLGIDPLQSAPLAPGDARRLAAALDAGVAAATAAGGPKAPPRVAAVALPAAALPAGTLDVGAAPWQRAAITLLPLGLCTAFGAAFVNGLRGPAGWVAGAACVVAGGWAAAVGGRAMRRVRLTLDPAGITFHDGTQERRAAWGDVARCGLEPGGRGRRPDAVVFRGTDDGALFAVSTQLCSRADTRRWMAYAEARLGACGARLYGPAGVWPGGATVGVVLAAALLGGCEPSTRRLDEATVYAGPAFRLTVVRHHERYPFHFNGVVFQVRCASARTAALPPAATGSGWMILGGGTALESRSAAELVPRVRAAYRALDDSTAVVTDGQFAVSRDACGTVRHWNAGEIPPAFVDTAALRAWCARTFETRCAAERFLRVHPARYTDVRVGAGGLVAFTVHSDAVAGRRPLAVRSPDGGRTWQVVWAGESGGSAAAARRPRVARGL